MPSSSVSETVVDRIARIVGRQGLMVDGQGHEPPAKSGDASVCSVVVVRPASSREVAAVVRICSDSGVGIVPQGGNTGLVGGAAPDERGGQVVLSLARLNRIRDMDPIGLTATVEAGCLLAAVQAELEALGLWLPLRLGAEGSCQIGGNLATNAGGAAAIRYGTARDLVLGLEVVLASGDIWDGVKRLRKDNTGYDLKQIFIGSEGTLGIITAAVLKVAPKPRQLHTALLAVPEPQAAMQLLHRLVLLASEHLTAFEYLDRAALVLALTELSGMRDPLPRPYGHYVLVELAASRGGEDLGACLEAALAEATGSGEVLDGIIAASRAQALTLWRLREAIPEAQRRFGVVIKHDISVPVSLVPRFLTLAKDLVARADPTILAAAFGHLGDGNIHFNLCLAGSGANEPLAVETETLSHAIYDLAVAMGGSFSAEHGIGRLRRAQMKTYKSPLDLTLMWALKRIFDPRNILNPGKVL